MAQESTVNDITSTLRGRRSTRLNQLQKILPSDRVSIEQDYPRLWASWNCKNSRKISHTVRKSDCDSSIISRVWSRELFHDACALSILADHGVNMTHLKTITLNVKGCWLLATANSFNAARPPLILFTHRKIAGNKTRTRSELISEVVDEFERQRASSFPHPPTSTSANVQLIRSSFVGQPTNYQKNPPIAQPSYYQKNDSQPICNRMSLHTRRAS